MAEAGKLYIVSTPIGNLRDITERAKEILSKVDFILAEDTRRSGHLLKALGIKTRLISYYDHNEAKRAPSIVKRLKEGESGAVISDGGTPLISDPGYRIVTACIEEGIKVLPVPGACAAIAALTISGLPCDRFVFEGFLPPKGSKRRKRIEAILRADCTSIVYESPHRIKKLISELAERDPSRQIVIARELTKAYEEVLRGCAIELKALLENRAALRGEIAVIVSRVQ